MLTLGRPVSFCGGLVTAMCLLGGDRGYDLGSAAERLEEAAKLGVGIGEHL